MLDTAIRGKTVTALEPDGKTRFKFTLAVVDVATLVPSNDPLTFKASAAFPAELQPRNRDRVATRTQVEGMAAGLQPDALLSDFMSLDRGAPIVGPNDYAVESGNGRVMALQRAAALHPEQFAEYEAALKARAPEFGLTAEQIARFKRPVLVRVRDFKTDRAEFARKANASAVIAQSSTENARVDAGNLTASMLNNLDVSADTPVEDAIRQRKNLAFVTAYLRTVPANERAQLLDEKGFLNQAGVRRVTTALFVKAYPGDTGLRLAEKFFESTDPAIRNVFRGMTASLVKMARAESMARAGERSKDLTIGNDLAKAVNTFMAVKASGRTVEEHLNQGRLFDRDLTPFQETLLKAIDDRSRSGRKIGELLNEYADVVIQSPPPEQTSMFAGGTKLTSAEAFGVAIRRVGDGKAPTAGQGALFDVKPAATFGAKTASESFGGQPTGSKPAVPPAPEPVAEVVTDPAAAQRIKNGIAEGKLVLKSKKPGGEKRSPDELAAIQRSIDRGEQRIGLRPLDKADRPSRNVRGRSTDGLTFGARLAAGRPAADHSLLSPSGRMSKAARERALKRESARIFGPGGLQRGEVKQPTEEVRLRQVAAELRDLAERGMGPRKHKREAERLEAKADVLAKGSTPEKPKAKPARPASGDTAKRRLTAKREPRRSRKDDPIEPVKITGTELERAAGNQTLPGRVIDVGIAAKNVAPVIARTRGERAAQLKWIRRPNSLDLAGVDTGSGAKPTTHGLAGGNRRKRGLAGGRRTSRRLAR